MLSNQNGQYAQSFVTAIPADLHSAEAEHFRKTIHTFPEEAVYIYSFLRGRMLYAAGWEAVLGYKDDEINLLTIVNATTPQFAPFSFDLNDKALTFIQSKQKDLEQYSFSIELKKFHKDGSEVPILARVGVFEAINGRVVSIIGRNQVNRGLTFGNVMRYSAFGPEKDEFDEELNKQLFRHLAISTKEKEALEMVAKGLSLKEIADRCNVSHSAIEKRILPLYKRFNVKSLPHLVSFAYDNHILP